MKASLRRQALILTAANTVTRGLGFVLRLLLARLMSAEALGVMELAGSVTMLAATPVTAGIPTAVSRLTARTSEQDRPRVLRAGTSLVGRMSLGLLPLVALLTPWLARLLGDARTVPAIAASIPTLTLMGLCGVYGGYCFGQDRPQLPAVNECVEQLVRVGLAGGLLLAFAGRDTALTAALPVAAEAAAGLVVLALFRRAFPRQRGLPADRSLMRELLRLSVPMMLARLCASGTRTLNAVLLPVCLRRSGLTAGAATAQYGLLTGMAMPLMMLPGVVTGALCTVSTPAVSRLEGQRALRRLVRRLYLSGLGIGLVAASGLYAFAGPLGAGLYRQAALTPLIRVLTPVALLASVRQVQFGMIAGLGLQARSLTGTIVSSALSLVLTAWLAPIPRLRLYGAALAAIAGQIVAVGWNAVLLALTLDRRRG